MRAKLLTPHCREKLLVGLKEQGLLEEKGTRLRLTSRGIDVSNRVLAEFLLD